MHRSITDHAANHYRLPPSTLKGCATGLGKVRARGLRLETIGGSSDSLIRRLRLCAPLT